LHPVVAAKRAIVERRQVADDQGEIRRECLNSLVALIGKDIEVVARRDANLPQLGLQVLRDLFCD